VLGKPIVSCKRASICFMVLSPCQFLGAHWIGPEGVALLYCVRGCQPK
jgi:hypothetical protein